MLIMGLMYLSSYPLTIAIRSSNQINKPENFKNGQLINESQVSILDIQKSGSKEIDRKSSLRIEAQRLILDDFTLIFIGMILILIIENPSIKNLPDFTSFKVIFEVISAYGKKSSSVKILFYIIL